MLRKTSRIICFIFQDCKAWGVFSDVGDYLVSSLRQQITIQLTFRFLLNGLSVGVENDLLSEALREVARQETWNSTAVLLYGQAIADLLKLNRSTSIGIEQVD